MDLEKDLLKQDLSNQEKPEEIKKFIEDAELLGHEDIAELGRKKLQEILEKADSIEKTSETQVAQVESMGGTGEEVSERTKEVDQKIEEVKIQTQEKITEVENENKGEVKTLYDEALERKQDGVEMFNALLKDGGNEAVDRRMKELWDHPSSPDGKKIEGLNTSRENLEYFSSDVNYIKNASPEVLEKIYSYGYGEQYNPRYLGKLLVAIEGLAFAQGFTSTYMDKKNGTKSDIKIDENLKSYIELANKMKEIDDRKREEYQDSLKRNHEENKKKDEDKAKQWQEENKK